MMKIDSEIIGGNGHIDKVLQFCLYVDRHGRMCELVGLLETLRNGAENWRRWCPEKQV